jgi:tRNA 2-thiouridine synthesizing protein A
MGVNKAEILDLIGLKCPLPALYARRALERAGAGAVLVVLSDDPLAGIDLPHMCRQEGYLVLASESDGTTFRITLQRPA